MAGISKPLSEDAGQKQRVRPVGEVKGHIGRTGREAPGGHVAAGAAVKASGGIRARTEHILPTDAMERVAGVTIEIDRLVVGQLF